MLYNVTCVNKGLVKVSRSVQLKSCLFGLDKDFGNATSLSEYHPKISMVIRKAKKRGVQTLLNLL